MLQDAAEGIKDLILGGGLAVFPSSGEGAWGIEISRLRDKPDRLIMVECSGGFPPEPRLGIDYPSVQVLVRGRRKGGSREAKIKAGEIKNLLLGLPRTIVGGDEWASVTMAGDIINAGYDEEDRPHYSMNFNMIVHPGDLDSGNRESC